MNYFLAILIEKKKFQFYSSILIIVARILSKKYWKIVKNYEIQNACIQRWQKRGIHKWRRSNIRDRRLGSVPKKRRTFFIVRRVSIKQTFSFWSILLIVTLTIVLMVSIFFKIIKYFSKDFNSKFLILESEQDNI